MQNILLGLSVVADSSHLLRLAEVLFSTPNNFYSENPVEALRYTGFLFDHSNKIISSYLNIGTIVPRFNHLENVVLNSEVQAEGFNILTESYRSMRAHLTTLSQLNDIVVKLCNKLSDAIIANSNIAALDKEIIIEILLVGGIAVSYILSIENTANLAVIALESLA